MKTSTKTLTPAFSGLVAALLFAPGAAAQDTLFSIDWHGPTNGVFDSLTGSLITNGDILAPSGGTPALGALPAPEMIIPHGFGGLGIFPGCTAPGAGVACRTEVDALSLGVDDMITSTAILEGALQFSVDTFATGVALAPPNVVTEAPFGDAAADVMRNIEPIPGLPAPPGVSLGHRGLFDGNGLVSGSGFVYAGLGLVEPSSPAFTPASTGDNVDAMELISPGAVVTSSVYYSLDSFWLDPLTGYSNAGTAISNGFSSADILVSIIGSTPSVYAPAAALGLDFLGPNQPDDVDALILWENGDGVYQPSLTPFDWVSGSTDMLLFSVRRGSPVIGMPDSIFGVPICEGDILTTPLPTGSGGVSPFPGIFVAAEVLGLGTLRSGTAGGNTSDDLDALDHRQEPFDDCDGDGIDDTIAIAMGLVPDANMNGVPDGCEVSTVCTPLNNSTGVPTDITIGFTGSPGTGVHLDGFDGPPGEFGFFLIGTGLSPTGLLSGAGRLCLETTGGDLISRYTFPGAMNSIGQFDALGNFQNLVGTSTTGYGFDIPTTIPFPIGGTILSGSTWHFQLWHRDVPTTWNFSNAVTYTF